MSELERQLEEAARSVWSGAKTIFWIAAALGWSGFWILIALLGIAFSSPIMIGTGAGVLALTGGTVFLRSRVRARRLRLQAGHELIARAELERLRLDRELEQAIRTFDVSYAKARTLIEESTLLEETLAIEASVDLERAREALHTVCKDKRKAYLDMNRLGMRTAINEQALDGLSRELSRYQGEAEKIVRDTVSLADRLSELRQLARGRDDAEVGRELEKVLGELDRTTKAFQEIADVEGDVARRIRAARALKTTR